jgi:serine protease AprX
MVRVVIQTQPGASGLDSAIRRLGGHVVSDLSFIHAAAAELPAGAIVQLPRYAAVSAISPDAPVTESNCENCGDSFANKPKSVYPQAVNADKLWDRPHKKLKGRNVNVAILDSGYSEHDDLRVTHNRSSDLRISGVNLTETASPLDEFGHGTHVAGIIGGNGAASQNNYRGIAPRVLMTSVKVCGDDGACYTSDVLEGMQWIYENGEAAGIRIVNISLNSTVAESYHTSPLCAAAEVLWFNNYIVVVSAGNLQDGVLYPPANDPFVITVGSADDQGTPAIKDDVISSFSAYGQTEQGYVKPELVAPGRNLVSLLNSREAKIAIDHPDHIVEPRNKKWDPYFRISGTSVSAAVVSGVAALLIQDEPELNADQVKYRLMATALKDDRWPAYNPQMAGAGYVNANAAVRARTTETANTGVEISQMLWPSVNGQNSGSVNWGTMAWNSVNWGTVNWGTVNWGTVNWGTVNWGTVNWGTDYWGP